MTHRYVVEGELRRPGDAKVETVSLLNAKAAFADLIVEGAKFATITEFIDNKPYVIGRYGCGPAYAPT